MLLYAIVVLCAALIIALIVALVESKRDIAEARRMQKLYARLIEIGRAQTNEKEKGGK